MPSVLLNGLYRNPACQAASDSTPKTSKWPYPDPTPGGAYGLALSSLTRYFVLF